MQSKSFQTLVGLFVLVAMLALLALAFKVSGFVHFSQDDYYPLTMQFDDIGDLRARAPVTIAGVTVGRVSHIDLDNDTFRAKVTVLINKQVDNLSDDTSAGILTEGLLGSNYIALTPGFDTTYLKSGGEIQTTRSAMILENLIGQVLYSLNDKSDDKEGKKPVGEVDAKK